MTIRQSNWCPTCQEACHDHETICTICGSALQDPPSSAVSTRPDMRPIPPEITADVREASQELSTLLSSLREQMRTIRTNVPLDNVQDAAAADWEEIPAEAMNPQTSRPTSRPTSKAILDKIPRITLETKSALLHQSTLELTVTADENNKQEKIHFMALLGEFGPSPPHFVPNAKLVVANPKTGKGGLSADTKSQLQDYKEKQPIILYMERGDGLTFVQKAIMAQEAGAVALVIGNNTVSPWPYVMKDSKREAEAYAAGGLSIPVVMVKKTDGLEIVDQCLSSNNVVGCSLKISASTNDCVVCRDTFGVSQQVMRLPSCGHVFHEACALSWLNHHNTCPYCRRELPTDDAEYEQERRRIQRTHAGSSNEATRSRNWEDFYG